MVGTVERSMANSKADEAPQTECENGTNAHVISRYIEALRQPQL